MDKTDLDFGFPEVGIWNTTKNIPLENLKMDAHMIWLLCSLLSCISWVAYITFYNSRIVGLLITKIINKWFIRGAFFKLGSLTFSPLAGKIMFRDFIYVSFDHSIRIQDGYIIFRWWRSYVPKDVSEDLSHSDTRLSIQLNGFELHFYNRSKLYDNLEHFFDLQPTVLLANTNLSAEDREKIKEHVMNLENKKHGVENKKRSEAMAATTWRDLIPVIKIDICSGRFVFGNRLTPTTLTISVEEAHCTYSTKPAVCKLDYFMHFIKSKIENAKVMFAPSPKYTGLVDEPPRYMGEGFVVMMSNFMEIYFYMDEPGSVPEEPVHLILANGDIVEPAPPVWGVDIKCGKGTDFSYGPWADRQRDHLFQFFFPPDWQKMVIASSPTPGEIRKYQSFDISLCTLNEATIDILFSKDKETNAMHVTVGPGSYIEVTLPWITQVNGYITKISGQLLHVEATTSLQYRSLAECESLEYKINVHFPTKWNDSQNWSINLTGCKATAFIVYKHKSFFQDLIEDWSSKSRPDILTFVPYTCKFTILLKDFEILTLSNEYNWIDCSSTNQENNHLAFCGDLFDLSFTLPFDHFLPQKVILKFWIHGEGLDLSLYVPEVSSTRPIVRAIHENAKILTRNGKTKKMVDIQCRKWRRICQASSGWIDCWSVPIVALSIQYIYHPIPPLGPDPQADITTPEKEEILLSPMRIPIIRKSPVVNWRLTDKCKFDPCILPSDQVTVELEIGSSVLFAYGNVLRNFIHLKENIFGEDQNFSDMEQSNVKIKTSNQSEANPRDFLMTKDIQPKTVTEKNIIEEKQKPFDSRSYRPLDVIVSVTIHDIQAHLLKNCSEIDPPCPVIVIERLGFEMKKRFTETELQVLVSPSYLIASDNLVRTVQDKHIKQGHILLSAVQVRGHAMFSNEGCKLDEETIEYAWMLEIIIGKFSGKLSVAQLSDILVSLETFIFLTLDPENCLKTPKTVKYCHHGSPINQCKQTNEIKKYKCPSAEDIKYKMTRLSIDAIDLYIIESGTALHTWISPVRLSSCNLHGQRVKSGVSCIIPSVLMRLFVLNSNNCMIGFNTTGSRLSSKFRRKNEQNKDDFESKRNIEKSFSFRSNKTDIPTVKPDESGLKREWEYDNWLEVGCMSLGPILLEGAAALSNPDQKLHMVQHNFLKAHDQKLKRLWFIWTNSNGSQTDVTRCGCIGGCAFFGGNRNGLKFFKPSPQDILDNFNIARYQILQNTKEFGFGESILHDGQLVFHTPPYSLQPVSLQENTEVIGRVLTNRKKSTENKYTSNKSEVTENVTYDRKNIISAKTKENDEMFQQSDMDRKLNFYNTSRQTSFEVPYARLLDSPSKISVKHESSETTQDLSLRRGSDPKPKILLKVCTPKNYVSDSRLTGEHYTEDDSQNVSEISRSAPHTHHLELGIDDAWTKNKEYSNEYYSDIQNEVQRTISLTSENPSEIFFSADEDIANIGNQNINSRNTYSTGSPNRRIIHDFRSDQNIYTKEPIISFQNTKKSAEQIESSSETPSLSSTSFISALSSQDDMTAMNLRRQVNRPIMESPLLMTSYLCHLPQLKCSNWNSCSFPPGPDAFSFQLFQTNENGGLTYIGNKLVPQFDSYHKWREFKLLPRYEKKSSNSSSPNIIFGPRCHPWDPSILLTEEDNEKYMSGFEHGEFMSLNGESAPSCTSLVIKFKGEVNIFFTPLMLEGLQRFIESLMPSISTMHLLSVVHFMHSFCINKVKNDNILKRDENLRLWSEVHSKSKRSTTEKNLQAPGDSVLSEVYEESISIKTQGLIILPKVSITLLQSSIVDEVCSMTNFDSFQDFTCVSLLSFYIEGISTKFHLGKTFKAAMHNVYIQQSVRSGNTNKKSGIMKGTKALLAHLSSQTRPDNVQGEPIVIETSEIQLEELVITLDIGRAHAQLRRLKNDGPETQQNTQIVTAIPEHKSKTMFECLRIPEINGIDDIGYIMFECGLEGVGIKIVKKSHFEKSENCEENDSSSANNSKVPSNCNNNDSNSIEIENNKTETLLKPKKPSTPKTPKEKFTQALEHIIITGEAAIKDSRNKATKPTFEEFENVEKLKSRKRIIDKKLPCHKETDKTSSCIIELKSVWFNFAAPPCVPITRKIDLTRLDWNFLSTASPAITAWMNPSNRFAMKIISLLRLIRIRQTSVAACLMADALENEKFQRKSHIKKSRYAGNYTLLSKTLQEDPSCQLCTIMQKLVLEEGVDKIESMFKLGEIPPLNILRQGVIVLSRQWKNSLYNPILFEHQYKNKLARPINVTFSFAQVDEECDDVEGEVDVDTSILSAPVENAEENENALLLGRIYNKSNFDTSELVQGYSTDTIQGQIPIENSLPGNNLQNRFQIPIISGLGDLPNPGVEYGTLRDGSGSSNSINKISGDKINERDDLYLYMDKYPDNTDKDIFREMPKKNSGVPAQSQSKKIWQDSIKLLDAHLIFEPLLTCLGVMPQQMINNISNTDLSSLENFGTNLSLIGTFDSVRVNIAESEAGDKKGNPTKRNKRETMKSLVSSDASFLCERVGIELEVLKMSDGLVDQAKQNVIFMSRSQLKKHTSTIINFSINVRFISQQINMPLLRLLHQITNMYQNVKDAQVEFHEQPEVGKKQPVPKDEFSLASDINDIMQFGSISDRFNQNENCFDERFEKFTDNKNQLLAFGSSNQINPSFHTKIRPQSFAQKLRSTGKSVKGKLGYTNLNDSKISPLRDSPTPLPGDNLNDFKNGRNNSISILNENAYNTFERTYCWKTIYHLLDLYGTMPETKMVQNSSFRIECNESDKQRKKMSDSCRNKRDDGSHTAPTSFSQEHIQSSAKTRLIIFGIAKIHKTRLLASLSGLKLEAEITTFNSSVTWRNKTRPVSLERSFTGQIGRAMIVLLEGLPPKQQTVVKMTIGKSQTLYSSINKKGKDKNSGLLSIGPVSIDIPQHPLVLHGMMTRSSKQLSSTLQELRVGRPSSKYARCSEETESPFRKREDRSKWYRHGYSVHTKHNQNKNRLLQPLVMQFNILLQSISVNAALLPSLQAQYKMNHVSSTGVTGTKAKFVIDLPTHTLSFATKIQTVEANLPSEACIALPPVHVSAEYISENNNEDIDLEGIILRQGSYVNASAEIGEFERCLTTDLLNHLVFVQKVFMKEVNEVIQKLYGGEKLLPLWLEDENIPENSIKRILFSLNISMKRIQLTATTPCSSAVRFETGILELHLSNRVKNVGEGHIPKLFGKAQIDFNLALGQIIKNVIFDEAEPEFQQYAFFHTTVALRNAFQDELVNEDKELILLSLKRPLVYIQPIAVDKAILVWLNYKNAYEYWAEKRSNLTNEVTMTGQQIFEKAAFGQLGNIAASNLSTLFLQLTVEDMGICLPLNSVTTTWGSRSYQDFEPKGAVVITLENTIISACNSGSLVSSGKFSGLCLRFADDFETTLDDWKPNMTDSSIMNLCVVSEGTYEVCSRTIAAKNKENAKWFLNVKWQMEGVDIHLDVNIGKQLSSLGHTLTMLTGFEEDDDNTLESGDSDEGDLNPRNNQVKKKDFDILPEFLFDPAIDSKKRSILMENEMSEQLKIINDLRTLGASQNTIAHEERRLQELQALCYKYFRRDMIQKWKRPSIRSSMLKPTNRSQSFAIPSYSKEPAEECNGKKLDTIISNDESLSLQSTPQSIYSLSTSIKTSTQNSQRAILSEALRQTSLPNTEFDSDMTENEIEWASYDDVQNEIEIDGSTVELRKKNSTQVQKQQEPNIDFELDIKVLINSGKCVLHTKSNSDDKYNIVGVSVNQHKRERSFGNEWESPTQSRKHRDKSKLRHCTHSAISPDMTAFHIPALDVKLHYQSKTIPEDISTKLYNSDPVIPVANRRFGNKRASLFAWMTLQSIPEETIISPHILEFLEQTLEPIPTKNESCMPSSVPVNLDLLPDNYVVYASFPVDVIVYFHMQPSTFRFSCLPVSRVECMLQLPSLDIVFSSKRSEDEEHVDYEKTPSGGLSITGCLADFNVYIFHPYGGKKSGIKEPQFSPLTDSERKNSLSINVEFVKFHITRCRKLFIDTISSKRVTAESQSRAVIRFSTIVDIGSASFKYDMRRLTEILAFPKAWYRRRIVRRLFLGDLSFHKTSQNDFDKSNSNDTKGTNVNERNEFVPEKQGVKVPNIEKEKKLEKTSSFDSNITQSEKNQITAWETLVLFGVNFTKLNVQMNMGNVMGNVIWLTKDFQSDGRLNIRSTSYKNMYIGIHLGSSSLDAKGGIVGGNFELSHIDTQFRIKEEAGIEPHHTMGLCLKALELRLDYMGTSILMTRISDFSTTMKDEWKTEENSLIRGYEVAMIFIHGDVSWDQLQIMISKSTTADILKMYYKLEEFFTQQFKSSKRVFSNLEPRFNDRQHSIKRKQKKIISGMAINYDIPLNTDSKHHRHWQKPLERVMGLMKPTQLTNVQPKNILGGTVVLHGTNISLACFHGINFKSKSWALFSLREPWINVVTEAQLSLNCEDLQAIQTLTCSLGQSSKNPQSHSMAIVSRITRNVIFPPQFKNLNEWFLYAFANSDIDAIDRFPILERDKEILSNSIERSRLSGVNTSKSQGHNHNREIIFALPSLQLNFKTEHKQGPSTPQLKEDKPTVLCSFITEFDDHIFVTVDADAFFFLHDLITSYINEKEKVMGAQNTRAISPNSSHTNNMTVKQTQIVADNNKSSNHNQLNTSGESNLQLNTDENCDTETDAFIRDWRRFECKTWHLEPTVRLLSWAGKSIEPYGIDYILNKLGFSHARTTIPKWMQRGFMDPFDKIQALLMIQLLNLVKENKIDKT